MFKKKNLLLAALAICALFWGVYATDIPVDANFGSTIPLTADVQAPPSSPPTIQDMNVCADGSCANYKALDPATEFTIRIKITDPNNDINYSSLKIKIYKTADDNACALDWDCTQVITPTYANGNGCTQGNDTNCVIFSSSAWATKFLAGGANIYAYVTDENITPNSADFQKTYSAGTQGILVNKTTGVTQDSATATYSVVPNTVQNAITTDQTNPYILTTNNGNTDLNISNQGADFTYLTNTITKENQKFNFENNYGAATPMDGTTQLIKNIFERGTYPTSATHSEWYWLSVPAAKPAGAYLSQIIFGSVES
jgi:hypothetical protein